jgi:hypothetical protein
LGLEVSSTASRQHQRRALVQQPARLHRITDQSPPEQIIPLLNDYAEAVTSAICDAAFRPQARAVVIVNDTVSDAELKRMGRARGVRFNLAQAGATTPETPLFS